MKTILDMCCSGREFWFNKAHPSVIYCDKRKGEFKISDGRMVDVNPDVVCDFTNLPFEAGKFDLVVFDPPHLSKLGETSNFAKKYGVLGEYWEDTIRLGFQEAFRVLKIGGCLIFKWNEFEIPVSKVIGLSPFEPLFGHKSGKQAKTHWMCFIKQSVLTV